jgi:serine/threonine protein kinase
VGWKRDKQKKKVYMSSVVGVISMRRLPVRVGDSKRAVSAHLPHLWRRSVMCVTENHLRARSYDALVSELNRAFASHGADAKTADAYCRGVVELSGLKCPPSSPEICSMVPPPLLPPPKPTPTPTHPLAPDVPWCDFVPNHLFGAQGVIKEEVPTPATLYGKIIRCRAASTGVDIIVKVSDLVQMIDTRRSLDDVFREAAIMRVLGLGGGEARGEPLVYDLLTAGSTVMTPASRRYLVQYYGECVTTLPTDGASSSSPSSSHTPTSPIVPEHHLIALEHVSGGDIFDACTDASLSNAELHARARKWGRQIALGVQYMHARSVAHMDISVENVCRRADGGVCLIDFGVAMRHPFATRQLTTTTTTDDEAIRRSRTDLERASDMAPLAAFHRGATHARRVACRRTYCTQCSTSDADIQREYDHVRARVCATRTEVPCRFLVRGGCVGTGLPGKPIYYAPEMWTCYETRLPFDAYKADVFAFGCMLYIFLTCGIPFANTRTRSGIDNAAWRTKLDGSWRGDKEVVAHLSDDAVDLLDAIFKPQDARPSIDDVLAHPFFT